MDQSDISPEGAFGKSVLIVEDDQNDVLLTTRAIKKSGVAANVTFVRDGVDAIARLTMPGCLPPNVIVLDLKLPRLDGFEVLQRLRACPAMACVPVVVMSSSIEDKDVRLAYSLGANSYVRKPVVYDQYVDCINGVVDFWLRLNVSLVVSY